MGPVRSQQGAPRVLLVKGSHVPSQQVPLSRVLPGQPSSPPPPRNQNDRRGKRAGAKVNHGRYCPLSRALVLKAFGSGLLTPVRLQGSVAHRHSGLKQGLESSKHVCGCEAPVQVAASWGDSALPPPHRVSIGKSRKFFFFPSLKNGSQKKTNCWCQ